VGGRAFDRIDDPAELAEAMEQAAERQRSFMASDRILVMLGYDHAGPDATFPERLDAARPHLRTVEASMGGLEQHLGSQQLIAEPPVWSGELRSGSRAHLLPNVYSARAHQKRERGRIESLIERYSEPLASLVPGVEWPTAELDRAWQLMLWNGAHDSACGCSHDQVALDVDARFAEARAIAESIAERATRELASRTEGPGVLWFNPSPIERDGVPGLGWRVKDAEPSQVKPVPLREGSDGSLLADGIELRFLDEPDVGDLYNFCWEEDDQMPRPPAEIRIEGATATLRFDDRLSVTLDVTRRPGDSFLRLDGVVTNARPDHRLRLHVALGGTVTGSLAGSPFELVERPLVGEGSGNETPSPTWPARHIVRAGDVVLFHEGVFEYEVVDGAALAITILRCVGTISRRTMATRPFPAGPDVPTPLAQMIGETAFSIGVLPGGGEGVTDLLCHWERFALPLVSAPSNGAAGSAAGTLIDVDGECALSGIRTVDGDVHIRLWNPFKDRAATASVDGVERTIPRASIMTIRSGEATAGRADAS
ncbi:MAG TPA: hypothetical protein VGR41_05420, partial [Actinomycetota bacterium]|nr:hypothetical protein [Actinomycetota bacterium]